VGEHYDDKWEEKNEKIVPWNSYSKVSYFEEMHR
jgi:hypothetical protein